MFIFDNYNRSVMRHSFNHLYILCIVLIFSICPLMLVYASPTQIGLGKSFWSLMVCSNSFIEEMLSNIIKLFESFINRSDSGALYGIVLFSKLLRIVHIFTYLPFLSIVVSFF